jgi:hypothetical protein
MSALYSIEEIKHRLSLQGLEIAQRLAPAGMVKGNQYWFRNPKRTDGGNLRSCSVNIRKGFWKDFSNAGGGEGGDMLHFICTFATGGDYKRAWRWALDYLGLTGKEPDPAEASRIAERVAASAREEADKLARTRGYCLHIWLEAKPLTGHDPASEYLAGRGIDINALEEGIPRALRYHPSAEARTFDYDGQPRQHYPAMLALAAIDGLKPNGLATIHATYLEAWPGGWRKAQRPNARPSKEVFCTYRGASVRLQRGISHKRLSDAPASSSILIAEGLENALTAAIAAPQERVIAALSLANLGNVLLPPTITSATLIADTDANNPEAERGLERAIDLLGDRGLELKVARAPGGAKDFNDALRNSA